MSELVQPMCCAVCWFPLDQYQGGWAHGRELYGGTDHVCVPVPWDSTRVQVRCDFCDRTVALATTNTLPAKDFQVIFDGKALWGSNGGWCACNDCADLIRADKWDELTDFALSFKLPADRKNGRFWLNLLYPALRVNITGPIRPYQEGDERVPAP